VAGRRKVRDKSGYCAGRASRYEECGGLSIPGFRTKSANLILSRKSLTMNRKSHKLRNLWLWPGIMIISFGRILSRCWPDFWAVFATPFFASHGPETLLS
jgi:hypothetical protein